jgi:hypothetical protein
MALRGPTDSTYAFVRNGHLVVIDGRGGVWKYDDSITTDENGDTIVAPSGIVYADTRANRDIVVIDGNGDMWVYDHATNKWTQGANVDTLPQAETDATTQPWKRGVNFADVETQSASATKSKSKKREREEA